jgi:hypothetical protein
MNWGAHKADVRIAAKNSVTMRAALRASINAQSIYEAYQDTQPFVTDNNAQDRARARAWAMMHVKIDQEPIKAALIKIYTDGYLLGLDASSEAVSKAEKSFNKAALTKADEYIDWANWKPGNRAAALLYRPTGAFKELLDNAGIVSKAIAKVGYDRIGTALSDSIAAGFSPGRAAKVIAAKIGDPARALTIAITEQNRAMSMATIQNYRDFGLEKMEWSGANPCDICAPNEGQVVTVGQPFKTGHTQPPVHPNCRCALLPVLDESFYAEPTGGMNLMPIEGAAEVAATAQPRFLTNREYKVIGNEQAEHLGELAREDYRALNAYKGGDYMRINGYLREGEKWFKLGQDPIENARIVGIWRGIINRIDKTIKATQPIKESFITYRGIRGEFADEVWNAAPGSVFQDLGFVSTTSSKKKALDFGGRVQLQIINPAGTQGLAIEGVIDAERHLKEYEWLLPAGTKFEIVSKTESYTTEAHLRIIKVRIVQ